MIQNGENSQVIFLINSLFGIFLTYKMVGILLKRLRISVKACILLYFIYYIINNLVYFLWENDKITLISNYICLYIIVFIAYDEYIWKKILVPFVACDYRLLHGRTVLVLANDIL